MFADVFVICGFCGVTRQQYEFPKDIGKKNKPFEQCTAVNANSGGVSITCPGSVFTALNGSDEIR